MTDPGLPLASGGDHGRLALWCDRAAVALVGVLALLVVTTFENYGISNDEYVQQVYGEKLLSFYRTGFTDVSAFSYENLYLYGGLFDLFAAILDKVSPLPIEDTRHLLSAAFGVLGVAGTWRLGRLVGGPRAGILAAVLLAATGAWYGGMFNHTKDIPFAAVMVWGLDSLCRISRALPRPSLSQTTAFGVWLGLALGLRVGALLLGVYAGLAVLVWLICRWRERTAVVAIVLRFGPAAVMAYALMAVAWPWSVFDPLNPLRALNEFAQFRYVVDTILNGTVYRMYDVPPTYVAAYLAIKLPLLALGGVILIVASFATLPLRRPRGRTSGHDPAAGLALIFVAAVFPILYFMVVEPPAYDGVRHFLFVVPPICVLAGIGLDRGMVAAGRYGTWAGRGVTVAGLMMLGMQVFALARLHPHEYLHYNALVGGVEGAQRRYVMDYWANSLPEATAGLVRHIERAAGERPIHRIFTVAVCAPRWAFEAVAPPFLRWTGDWRRADFFVAPTHMNCDFHLGGRVVLEVRRQDAVVAVVKDRRRLVVGREVR